MTSFDAIDAHIRHAMLGGGIGAIAGSSGSIVLCLSCTCAGAILMVLAGRKHALTPKPTRAAKR